MSALKKEETFVNRHGRRLGVTSAELAELSIDEPVQADVPAPNSTPKRARAKSKNAPVATPRQAEVADKKPPRRQFMLTKKTKFILGGIIIALIAAPIVTGEILRAQYLASASSANNDFKHLVKADVLPQQKAANLSSKQLLDTIIKLESIRDDMCPGALLDNVAALYPRAHAAHTSCINKRGSIATLSTQLRTLQKEMVYSEAVDAALTQVTAPTPDAFAVIGAQHDNWRQMQEKVAKITPPTEFATAHTQLTGATQTVVEGWSKLNIANNEQNAENFTAAEKQLGEGYDAVRASKEGFISKMIEQQNAVSTVAQKIVQ